jgi:hypothetical protein
MPDLSPVRRDHLFTPRTVSVQRRTVRALADIEHRTIVRAAAVQGEEVVQAEKLDSIDHLTREAMSGHAMLRNWGGTLSQGDPFITDELKFFIDTARLGKGEVIADTISTYCRDSRS